MHITRHSVLYRSRQDHLMDELFSRDYTSTAEGERVTHHKTGNLRHVNALIDRTAIWKVETAY